jgi:phage terminase large subunit
MTTPIVREVDARVGRIGRVRRRPDAQPHELQTFAGSIASCIRAAQLTVANSNIRFPNTRYQADPTRFAREVLGVQPWHKQIEIMEAVRDHRRVAVKSGHKVSKSHTAAIIALWFYCSFHDARVIMSSTTARQVDQILWRELRMMRARSGRCLDCKAEDPEGLRIPKPCPHSATIEGELGDLARTGLKSPDFREIVGFTAREAEAVAGISGSNLLYILDEASGIPPVIHEAIAGNLAGGGRELKLGNPTRNSGEFFDAFHSKARFHHCITVSSEETPNVKTGRQIIPGLATREWILEKQDEWGIDSALYAIRVKGEFAVNEAGRIFSVYTIEQAEIRWHTTEAAGRLYIGVDPAGETNTGDEIMFASRRGLKLLALHPHRGISAEMIVTHIARLITELRLPREVPVVVIDAEEGVATARRLPRPISKHVRARARVRIQPCRARAAKLRARARRARRQP